jgi:tripartite-type tricarboxylate transporter receptor subunit TctC
MQVFKAFTRCGVALSRRTLCIALATLSVGVFGMGQARAAYPDKPIHIVVSYPPAGAADIMSRAIAAKISADLKQPVIVENRPGANGAIGVSHVARADADGYTVYVGALTTLAIAAATIPGQQQYNLVDNFEPVGAVANAPHVLVVPASLPVNSVPELIAYVKKNPGKYTFASQGTGSLSHLEAVMLIMSSGMDLLHVPYKGSAAALPEVINGTSVMFFDSMSSSIGQIQGGNLKALAVPTAKRSSLLPNVPTLLESGQNITANSLFAMYAPKGTPAAALRTLSASLEKALASPDLKKQLSSSGMETEYAPGSVLAETTKDEYKKWAAVTKAANIKLE